MGMKVNAVKQMVCHSKNCSPAKPETTNASTFFDNFTVGGIRRYIHKKFADKKHLILYDLSTELKNEGLIPEQTSHTAIWRLIHTMGLYTQSQRKMYVRKESADVVSRQIRTLQALKHC